MLLTRLDAPSTGTRPRMPPAKKKINICHASVGPKPSQKFIPGAKRKKKIRTYPSKHSPLENIQTLPILHEGKDKKKNRKDSERTENFELA